MVGAEFYLSEGGSRGMRLAELLDAIEEVFPSRWAADWDNVGLTIGRTEADIYRILVALEVTEETVTEAMERRCELLVTHHPFPWHARRRYDLAVPEDRLLAQIFAAGLNLLAVHTNLDAAPEGHATVLARRLGLTDLRPLKPGGDRLVKIVVFAPRGEAAARVRAAMAEAGAGKIGLYRGCSFSTAGIGRFIPEEGARPAIGRIGHEEEVEEERIEAICRAGLVDRVLRAVRAVHPYETMAYDIFPEECGEEGVGFGRIGRMASPVTAEVFLARLKEVLNCREISATGFLPPTIERVAIAPGAAGDLIEPAVAGKAQVMVVGEISYHDALAARARGMALLIGGHYSTEMAALGILAEHLRKIGGDRVEVLITEKEKNPFHAY